jgi:hypothetical protein
VTIKHAFDFQHIFEASSVAAGTKYLIRASYLEIYNESIRDLLGKDVKAALDLKVTKTHFVGPIYLLIVQFFKGICR